MRSKKEERLGEVSISNQGCTMKIIKYDNYNNILVEFQDEYKTQINTSYYNFIHGGIRNPYFPTICNVGITGNKHVACFTNKVKSEEYKLWTSMITRCYSGVNQYTESFYHRYQDVEVCKEWLLFDNFYDWVHSQNNFEQLVNIKDLQLDKDIIQKGNKIYSPETCCLVPRRVNVLFIKSDKARGNYPIGVTYKTRDKVFEVQCNVDGKETYLGRVRDPIEGFYIYKNFKEKLIKQIAQKEYDKGNIIKKCYDAMMKYEVEITD